MDSFLGSLLVGLFKLILGFFQKRKAASDAVKAANNQASAEAHSGVIRDQTDISVEKAREDNEEALSAARDDAAGAAGLQKQSVDVNAAIAKANGELR